MSRFEKRDVKRAPVALETVAKGRKRAVGVHPFAQVREHLFTGLIAKEGFQPGPFRGLGLADEAEDGVGEDRVVAVEALTCNGNVAFVEQVCFDNCFEGGLIGLAHLAHTSDFTKYRTHLTRYFASMISVPHVFLSSKPFGVICCDT